ncbi:MAG: hypothetical protein PF569_07185 [Candidatus Woesearchaeota archaeon]|jgi:hypothetical protein|nr:hypothetical protein [Candidatus Woesearchaeota archaeon]
MGRIKKNKILISMKIDVELKEILDKKKYNKSALINALLWKYVGMQNNLSLISSPISPISMTGVEPATSTLPMSRSTTEPQQQLMLYH